MTYRTLFPILAAALTAGCVTAPAPPAATPAAAAPAASATIPGTNSVRDFGAVADGTTDCAPAFQRAMDAVAANGGGEVLVPTGRYSFSSPLVLPKEVTLRGVYTYAPSHAGIRDKFEHSLGRLRKCKEVD